MYQDKFNKIICSRKRSMEKWNWKYMYYLLAFFGTIVFWICS